MPKLATQYQHNVTDVTLFPGLRASEHIFSDEMWDLCKKEQLYVTMLCLEK
jgi:hypothetical protein